MELKGKIIDFLGDSITEGFGVSNLENRYDNIIKRECELEQVYNYGIGGTRFAYQSQPSVKPRYDLYFCGRVYDLNEDADIIVVYGGVNDYLHGDAPIGKFGDITPKTFYGAVRFLMNFLKENYGDKKIAFVAPAKACLDNMSYLKPSTRPTKKPDALPLYEYVKIIKKTAELYDFPVLDLYETLGIDPTNVEDREKYTTDGLHFNDEGHKIIAKRIKEFLLKL